MTRCLPSSFEMLGEPLASSMFLCEGLRVAHGVQPGRLRLLASQCTTGERKTVRASVL